MYQRNNGHRSTSEMIIKQTTLNRFKHSEFVLLRTKDSMKELPSFVASRDPSMTRSGITKNKWGSLKELTLQLESPVI